jgi:hypothetical protein
MRSIIAIALSFSCVGLLAAANPACSSSSPSGSDASTDTKSTTDVVTTKDMSAPYCQSPPGDAAGLLPSGCGQCLATMCGSGEGDLLSQCACEPDCILALQCLDACVKAMGSGAVTSCALTCTGKYDDAGGFASTGPLLLSCAQGACKTACSASSSDAATEAAPPDASGDAADGS